MAPLARADYKVGWVCALAIELAAALVLLDAEHDDLPQVEGDSNVYTLGRIGQHNVVIAALPDGEIGTGSAAAVASQMAISFPGVKVGLLVGIGGGVPTNGVDVRLGDIVVSRPENRHGGVLQYDLGKARPESLQPTGFLDAPPRYLRSAVTKLRANHARGVSQMSAYLQNLAEQTSGLFVRDPASADILFMSDYDHVRGQSCEACDASKIINRESARMFPEIHYGTIASGNRVMRHGTERDEISAASGNALCFEMEAAGLLNKFPSLVIRGIADYADSHKNDDWQGYAAGVAAAYAKDLLMLLPTPSVATTQATPEPIRLPERAIQLPFSKNPRFIGRIAVLTQLKKRLWKDKKCKRLAIFGLGGIGKTQVALRFAYHVVERYPSYSIFWISAVSEETVEQSFQDIADRLNLRHQSSNAEDIKVLVKRRLSSESTGDWIIIVDNADDEKLWKPGDSTGLLEHIPQSRSGMTIFTTRTRLVAQAVAGSDVIEIAKMNRQEASRLFASSLFTAMSRGHDEALATLLEQLDYLPLAISQAAAYMNTNDITVPEYLKLARTTEENLIVLMSSELRDSTRHEQASNAIATTWIVSFQQIVQDPAAARLLEFISCIEWKAIPHSILPMLEPAVRMTSAIGKLCSYSFVTKRGEKTKYDMHRLVHLAARIWYTKHGRINKLRTRALQHVLTIFPDSEYRNRETWRDYIAHVARIDHDAKGQNVRRSLLCLKVGSCLEADGRTQECLSWLIRAGRYTRTLPEKNASRLIAQKALAKAYSMNNQHEDAQKLYEKIIRLAEMTLDERHPIRLSQQHDQATAHDLKTHNCSAKLLEVAKHRVKESAKLPADHASRLASQHTLAMAYRLDGQTREAIKLLQHIVRVQQKLADNHPSRLTSQHKLATAYELDGQTKEAVELLEHVVHINEGLLARNDPSLLALQCQLAMAYRKNGQIAESSLQLEHVVSVQDALADDHPDRLAVQQALRETYQASETIKESLNLLESSSLAESRKRTAEGAEFLSSFATYHALALMWAKQRRFRQAKHIMTGCVEGRTILLGDKHPDTLDSIAQLQRIASCL